MNRFVAVSVDTNFKATVHQPTSKMQVFSTRGHAERAANKARERKDVLGAVVVELR